MTRPEHDLHKAFEIFKASPRVENDSSALPRPRAGNENDAYEPRAVKKASGMKAAK